MIVDVQKAKFFPGRFYQFRNVQFVPSFGATPLQSPSVTPPETPPPPPQSLIGRWGELRSSKTGTGDTPPSVSPTADGHRGGSQKPHTALCIASPSGTQHSTFLLVTSQKPARACRHLHLRIVERRNGDPLDGEVGTLAPLDANDGPGPLFLYLGRTHCFFQGNVDLDYKLLRNGLSKAELKHVVNAYINAVLLSDGRYTFKKLPVSSSQDSGGASGSGGIGTRDEGDGSRFSHNPTTSNRQTGLEVGHHIKEGTCDAGMDTGELYEELRTLNEYFAIEGTSISVGPIDDWCGEDEHDEDDNDDNDDDDDREGEEGAIYPTPGWDDDEEETLEDVCASIRALRAQVVECS